MSTHVKDWFIELELQNNTACDWNEKRKRFEAMVPNVREKGYGATKNDAYAMMRKILRNMEFGRPLLGDIQEHENYQSSMVPQEPVGSPQPQVVYNIGVMNTGTMSNIQSLNVALDTSVQQLQQTLPDIAECLKRMASVINGSMALSETKKTEGLDYVDVIAKEAEKPPQQRMTHRVVNSMKGIKDLIVGIGAAKEIWEKAEPIIMGLISQLPM